MVVLPLQFLPGQGAASLGLTGEETFTIRGIGGIGGDAKRMTVQADDKQFEVMVRIDTPTEAAYSRHGGILPYVLRHLRQM